MSASAVRTMSSTAADPVSMFRPAPSVLRLGDRKLMNAHGAPRAAVLSPLFCGCASNRVARGGGVASSDSRLRHRTGRPMTAGQLERAPRRHPGDV